jgi:hypothetical protein
MQILGEKIRNIENKHKDERNQLLDIIQNNVLKNNALNLTEKENKRKMVKDQIERLRNKMKSEDDSNDEEKKHRSNKSGISSTKKELEELKKKLEQSEEEEKKKENVKPSKTSSVIDNNVLNQNPNNINTPSNQKFLTDNDKVTNTLRSIKDEISSKLHESSLKNKENFDDIGINFKKLKNDVWNKIDYMEHKLRDVTRKVLDGELKLEEEEKEQKKNRQRNQVKVNYFI